MLTTTSPSKGRAASALGLVVTDSAFKLLSANHAAIAILTAGEKEGRPPKLAEAFERKLQSNLVRRHGARNGAPSAIRFNSGRRTYFCRSFVLDAAQNASCNPLIVMVLERGLSESMALSQIAEQFHLTGREREAVTLLLEGLSNKEMADRMTISANTVKALLRLIMLKMHVASRSAVVATILRLMVSTTSQQKTSPSGEWKSTPGSATISAWKTSNSGDILRDSAPLRCAAGVRVQGEVQNLIPAKHRVAG